MPTIEEAPVASPIDTRGSLMTAPVVESRTDLTDDMARQPDGRPSRTAPPTVSLAKSVGYDFFKSFRSHLDDFLESLLEFGFDLLKFSLEFGLEMLKFGVVIYGITFMSQLADPHATENSAPSFAFIDQIHTWSVALRHLLLPSGPLARVVWKRTLRWLRARPKQK
jgi:hypothetical protein